MYVLLYFLMGTLCAVLGWSAVVDQLTIKSLYKMVELVDAKTPIPRAVSVIIKASCQALVGTLLILILFWPVFVVLYIWDKLVAWLKPKR